MSDHLIPAQRVSGMLPPCDEQSAAVQLVLTLSNRFDCDAVASLFQGNELFRIQKIFSDVEILSEQCCLLHPDVVVLDSSCGEGEYLLALAVQIVLQKQARHVILLDDRIREGFVSMILGYQGVSNLTRLAGFSILCDAVLQVAKNGGRVFDPAIAHRIRKTSRGWKLDHAFEYPTVASLSVRELEILKLLAIGRSVRECAAQLGLKKSTIDNHKTRLMKKLQVHKTAELTRLAIRDGLIGA